MDFDLFRLFIMSKVVLSTTLPLDFQQKMAIACIASLIEKGTAVVYTVDVPNICRLVNRGDKIAFNP